MIVFTALIELPPAMAGAAKMVRAGLRWLAARAGWTMHDGYWRSSDGDKT